MRDPTLDLIVSLAFVIDCTSSMGPWIDEVRIKVREIVDSTCDLHPTATVQVALVTYRDYGDYGQVSVVDFTSSNQIAHALEHVRAFGGRDIAEDVAGALDAATRLLWDPSDVRLLVHITDAPAHGARFHAAHISDRYIAGDPEGKCPVRALRTLVDRNVEVTFVRITSDTDMMTEVFLETCRSRGGQFSVLDLHAQSDAAPHERAEPAMLSPAVSRAVSNAVTRYTSSQSE